MTFDTKLTELLKTDARFVDDGGELLAVAVQDAAWKTDRALIKLLLSDAAVKAKFFESIEDDKGESHWVFSANTFLDFVSQKNFLANSYTRFRNRIGLTIDDKYLRERGEVALAWPYKDCVLEGGQTREEERRKEIFFNEILAHDEINRLLDPKVLTGFARYTANGKEEVQELRRNADGVLRENLLLKGNNLLALHSLKKQFRGKVKLIYIDPPYNTGNDSFGYNDNFNHSAWLTFMKNRLEAGRNLLREDGFFCCHIDNNEGEYLKVLMDEVFGVENYLNTFYVRVRYPDKTLKQDMDFHKEIEAIHIYRKSKSAKPKLIEIETTIEKYVFYFKEVGKGREIELGGKKVIVFRQDEIIIEQKKHTSKGRKEIWATGSILDGNSSGRFFRDYLSGRYTEDGLGVVYKVYGVGEETDGYRYFTGPQKQGATKGKYFQGIPSSQTQSESNVKTVPINNFYDLAGSFGNCRTEGGVELRSGKKPEELLKIILSHFSEKNDIVLDFHLGSGTTAAAAHKMGRQFIGIEQLDYGDNDSVIRLQNVVGRHIKKSGKLLDDLEYDTGGISKSVNWHGGGDFVYGELTPYNEKFMAQIQAAKSSAELLKVYRTIAKDSFLNWYVNAKEPENAEADFAKLIAENGLEAQKKLLCELLDKNQLYVNLSEIDDTQFKVSKADKDLNAAFYGDSADA